VAAAEGQAWPWPCLAIIDGLPTKQAVTYVRQHYDQHSIETPWQKHYVIRCHNTPRRAGMTQPALSRLEAGGVIPTVPLLERISTALDADLIVQIAPHSA
jgi:Helix-turn-helix